VLSIHVKEFWRFKILLFQSQDLELQLKLNNKLIRFIYISSSPQTYTNYTLLQGFTQLLTYRFVITI